MVHRLAIVYLLLPVAIWLVGWHQWWLGIPVSALLGLALWWVLSGSWKVSPRLLTVLLLFIALAWVMATAAGGVFDIHNFDWIKHRAILLDLSRSAWPVYLPTWISDLTIYLPGNDILEGSLLRYYLGFYIVPGLLGKWFGVEALNWAVPLWTWCGVALMLIMFTRRYRGWKAAAAALILIFFSGIDIVTVVLFEGLEWLDFSVSIQGWPEIRLGRIFPERYLPEDIKVLYLSHMVGMMWVPQHFIAGTLYAFLLLQLRRHARFLAVSGVVVGASVFWSPFVAIGLLPFAAVLLTENGIRPFLRWQNVIFAPALVAILAAYLSAGTGDIPHFWLWELFDWRIVVRMLPVLFLTEFLLLALLLSLLRYQLWRDRLFVASLAVLLLLPLYYFGLHNDLVMRGLIPALAMLCYFCAKTLLGRQHEVACEGRNHRRIILKGLVLAVLGIGALGPSLNLLEANNNRNFAVSRYAQFGLDHTTSQSVGEPIAGQYLVDRVPSWYRTLLRDSDGDPGLAKSELIISSIFDVYLLNDRILVYTKTPCTHDEMEARFILSLFPLEERGNVQETLDFQFNQGAGFTVGETCVTSRPLPNYEVGRIRAGQYKLDHRGHSWLGNYFNEEYRDRLISEAGEPIIRSNFDVYVRQNTLIYSKASCNRDDEEASFFLHVTPVDAKSLPEDSRQEGLERMEFGFSEHGGRIGESCLVVHELPDYPVLRIKTGQHIPQGGPIWEGNSSIER